VALILDTNALSAIADGDGEAVAVLSRAERVAVSVVVLGEYRFGIAHSRHRTSYENWLGAWSADVEILEIDERTSRFYAAIGLELRKMGKPIPSNDVWIASSCRQHSLPLMSRDRHFDLVPGLQRIGW
jgi:tRNA(fMet)-specific endonuclease VapC